MRQIRDRQGLGPPRLRVRPWLCPRGRLSLPGMCLGELVINPHQQHMDAFYWVIDWEGMISVSSLVGLLEKHFFPKWLQVRLVLLGMGELT